MFDFSILIAALATELVEDHELDSDDLQLVLEQLEWDGVHLHLQIIMNNGVLLAHLLWVSPNF